MLFLGLLNFNQRSKRSFGVKKEQGAAVVSLSGGSDRPQVRCDRGFVCCIHVRCRKADVVQSALGISGEEPAHWRVLGKRLHQLDPDIRELCVCHSNGLLGNGHRGTDGSPEVVPVERYCGVQVGDRNRDMVDRREITPIHILAN